MADRSDGILRRSLWLRVVAVLIGFVALTTGALFIGVDHFVSARFRALHDDRLARLVALTRQAVDRELRQLASLANLLVGDVDLVNSTYYHLYLEGERDHPQAAVERIGQAFRIRSVALWSARGDLIAANGGTAASVPLVPFADQSLAGARAEVLWQDDEVWIVAVGTLLHNENVLARIQLARPLAEVLTALFGAGGDIAVRLAAGEPSPGAIRVPLETPQARPVALDLSAPDVVAVALHDVKGLLGGIMAVFGVLLAAAIAMLLRWQLRPVTELTAAAQAVGQGDFERRVPAQGTGEVAELARAFNAMAEGLARLRELERRLRHEEQLSAIGRVAARVSHDINNPLTVISNVARLLERRIGRDDPAAEDVRLILHHSQRCIAIVQNLLEYGRPIQVKPVVLDLTVTCREIVERWRRRFDAAVPVRLGLPGGPLPVAADPFHLAQMLDNLLDNAHEAGGGGEIGVEVEPANGYAVVRVMDQGPGFSEEARRHLFEPFFTTKTGGTGLGLASALAVIRAHGGDIEIADSPGGHIAVRLPLAPGQSLTPGP